MTTLTIVQVVAIAVGLCMDTLAVSAAVGLGYSPITWRTVFRISWHFTLFQVSLLVLGYFAGSVIDDYLGVYRMYLAGGLLCLIGGHMCVEFWRNEAVTYRSDPSRGMKLMILSVVTSTDALAVGTSLAFAGWPIFFGAVVVGVTTASFAIIGLEVGKRAERLLGRWSFLVGGVTLCGFGVKMIAMG